MTDVDHGATGYRITFETFNGFFGAWLKRNLFTRRRLYITLGVALMLLCAGAFMASRNFTGPPNGLPMPVNILIVGLTTVLAFPVYFLMVAIPIYVLFPVFSYIWLAASFATSPVSKRINNADVSDQGIIKTFENHEHTTPWSAVHDLVETRKSLLIFTNRNSAMMIPKSGFATPEKAAAFWSSANSYWQQARASTSDVN